MIKKIMTSQYKFCLSGPLHTSSYENSRCYLPNGLFSLRLSDFRLLISLGYDVTEGGPSDGPLELCCTPSTLFGNLLRLTLLVFPSVQHSPVDLTRVSFHLMRSLTFCIDELEDLKNKSIWRVYVPHLLIFVQVASV